MRPKTAKQVCDLLIREGWDPGTVFYEGAKDCRNIGAGLIRDALPALRTHPSAGKDVRALAQSVRTQEGDDLVEASWRAAIDALRALCRTSPKGTRRERETLLSMARDKSLVRAMRAAASSEPRIDPSWLAVLNAEGSPESLALVLRHTAGLTSYPEVVAAIASFEGALLHGPSSAPTVDASQADSSPPMRSGAGAPTRAHFWALIDGASGTMDPIGALGEWLREMTPAQIVAFDRHLAAAMDRAHRIDLWGAAFLLLGGCSDDSFSDFRADLILRGKKVFESVLEIPDRLADHSDVQGDESLANLAAEIYEEKTGRTPPRRRPASASQRPAGTSFDFDDQDEMRRRYPRLFALRMPTRQV